MLGGRADIHGCGSVILPILPALAITGMVIFNSRLPSTISQVHGIADAKDTSLNVPTSSVVITLP